LTIRPRICRGSQRKLDSDSIILGQLEGLEATSALLRFEVDSPVQRATCGLTRHGTAPSRLWLFVDTISRPKYVEA
jgi:hypothetical protein